MPSIHIPPQSTRRWTGPYLGDFYGTLWKTFNIDLDRREGKVSLSRRLVKVADTSDTNLINMGSIAGFLRTDADGQDRWWGFVNRGRLFKIDSDATTLTDPDTTWDRDTLDSSPTDARDIWIHENDSDSGAGENRLLVATDCNISVLNDTANNVWTGSWWVGVKSQTGLDTGVPHPGDYFKKVRKSLVGSRNKVHTIDKDGNVTANRLSFPNYFQVEHIFSTRDRAWFLLSHTRGGEGGVGEWDGSAESFNNIYPIKSSTPLSGIGLNDIPIIINNSGEILEWNGNGFVPMERNGQKIAFPLEDDQKSDLTGLISRRGMTVDENGLIYINVRGSADAFKYVSGIWCLNPDKGRLYDKFSYGDTDYGEQALAGVGAIQSVKSSNSQKFLLVGGQNFTTSGTGTAGIWVPQLFSSTTPNRGYFITQYIAADDVQDFWDTLWVRFRRFISTDNRIIVKARVGRPLMRQETLSPLQGTITWTSTTTFTVTLGSTDDSLIVGDEVEIMNGDNAGVLAHITTISGAHAALQTITIDETMISGTSTSLARFDRWRKLGEISSSTKYEDKVDVGIAQSFIQFKVEMRGPAYQMEIESLIANSGPHINKSEA